MGDPVTMALIGAGTGAMTSDDPLKGALLGGAMGGIGGGIGKAFSPMASSGTQMASGMEVGMQGMKDMAAPLTGTANISAATPPALSPTGGWTPLPGNVGNRFTEQVAQGMAQSGGLPGAGAAINAPPGIMQNLKNNLSNPQKMSQMAAIKAMMPQQPQNKTVAAPRVPPNMPRQSFSNLGPQGRMARRPMPPSMRFGR